MMTIYLQEVPHSLTKKQRRVNVARCKALVKKAKKSLQSVETPQGKDELQNFIQILLEIAKRTVNEDYRVLIYDLDNTKTKIADDGLNRTITAVRAGAVTGF